MIKKPLGQRAFSFPQLGTRDAEQQNATVESELSREYTAIYITVH